VIGMSPPQGRPSRLKLVTIVVLATVAVLVILGLIGSWEPSAIAYSVITLVGGFVYLCYLIWEIATGRVGLIHWTPTARRQRRLARRVAARDEAAQRSGFRGSPPRPARR
jgi:threonine/homoserine/homoserine lactone efflux protein